VDALFTFLFFVAVWLVARYLKHHPRPGGGAGAPDTNGSPTTKDEP
jgi:hypothetical protein